MTTRYRINVNGIVQGVGFRPYIYKLANEYKLTGWVRNNTEGVEIEIQGLGNNCRDFIDIVPKKKPAIAYIQSYNYQEIDLESDSIYFKIIKSNSEDRIDTIISPDIAICKDCLDELFDPNDKRYRYPFINCTNCGPRYTIIKKIPYDRQFTTMNQFKMCDECDSEYNNPDNRRFHAQPNACDVCGPIIFLTDNNGNDIKADDPIEYTIKLLKDGNVMAVKGLGGFHLVCDATNNEAVLKLRQRKHRDEKPFAIMSLSTYFIEKYAILNDITINELSSPQSPIVLLPKKNDNLLSNYVAPDSKYYGVMLPYTPLHYLLFNNHPKANESEFLALVMTSANKSEEPIVTDNDEAIYELSKISNIADYFLLHNRDIHIRVDDSIVKISDDHRQIFRRSRGYAPFPIISKKTYPDMLAVGAELKNTIAFSKGNKIFPSQYLGDLTNTKVIDTFHDTIEHIKNMYSINPKYILHDLHPHYYSSTWAKDQNIECKGIQHHYAHFASVLAEYDLYEPAIGLIMDGTGYGIDKKIWGSEVLIYSNDINIESIDNNDDLSFMKRAAHFNYLNLPGGDKAIEAPWKIALSWLNQIDNSEIINFYIDRLIEYGIDIKDIQIIQKISNNNKLSPQSCGLGRYFDAFSSLLGISYNISYEAQGAIKLEQIADFNTNDIYNYEINMNYKPYLLNLNNIIFEYFKDLKNGRKINYIARKFHNTLSHILLEICLGLKKETSINNIILSGGCWQNEIFTKDVFNKLTDNNFSVYIPKEYPVNDSCIAMGQLFLGQKIYN